MLSSLLFRAALMTGFVLIAFGLENSEIRKRDPTEGFTYLGCFKDSAPRVLREGEPSNSSATSFVGCATTCFQAGYSLAGVEYGDECYCGNAILYNYGSSEQCNMPCPGNTSNTCGGPDAMQIYSTGAGPYTVGPASFVLQYNDWKVTECWEDNWRFGARILPHTPHNDPPSQSMTVEKCINACDASTYTSAGLEWGQECWCGNVTYAPGESVPSSECEMPCNGNATENCGGSDLILIYTNLGIPLPGLF